MRISPCMLITADDASLVGGGASVVRQELAAIREADFLDGSSLSDRRYLSAVITQNGITGEDPWIWDAAALRTVSSSHSTVPKFTHFYAGTFTRTISYLRSRGVKISYTAAAHDVNKSKEAHNRFAIPFNYPHLTNPELWKNYVQGYLESDLLICPSRHSADVMQSYGYQRPIRIIPHGVDLPSTDNLREPPGHFRLGYLGSYGPDKNWLLLLAAWKRLGYKNATLVLAGRDSTSGFVGSAIRHYGLTTVRCLGWVANVADFYNDISCYCQPSLTEGFGIEVLEACAHARPVLCSTGAGACDIVPDGWKFDPENLDELCQKIELAREIMLMRSNDFLAQWRKRAEKYTWDKIRGMYVETWKELLSS